MKKPEPEDWVTKDDWEEIINRPHLNILLTRKYGSPPTVHIFNGEPPKEFGLEEDTWILFYNKDYNFWDFIIYDTLTVGDRWRCPLPAPKENQ